jgi:hypothetical protein
MEWPTRRKLLKRAALAAPALILPKPVRAFLPHGTNLPAAPAQAAAYGLNTLTFYDPCTSLTTVDLNNTKAPGYLWYTNNAWPYAAAEGWFRTPTLPPTGADMLLFNNGIVLLGNDAVNGGGPVLESAVTNGTGYTGNAINMANGAYFEIQMQADPVLGNGATGWPSFWSMPLEYFLGSATHFVELDFVEYPGASPPTDMQFAIHDWNTVARTNNQNTNVNSAATDANVHTFGTLYLSSNFNGGSGLVRRFIDGVWDYDRGVSFTTTGGCSPGATPANPNGIFSEIQGMHHVLILTAGTNWPMTVKHVAVWQQSAAG